MNWLDFILIILIVLGIVRGLMKGLILEVSSFIGIIIGIFIARIYYIGLAGYLQKWLDISITYAKPLGFILIFFAVAAALYLVAVVIDKFVKAIALGWFNRLLGALFGCLKVIIILSIAINAFDVFNEKINLVDSKTIENSALYKPIQDSLSFVTPYFTS